jgi:hypothetical protein
LHTHRALWTLALLAISGCNYQEVLEKIAPKQEVEFAREYLGHLRAGRIDEVERHLNPALLGPETHASLQQASRAFPSGEPRSAELIGAHVGTGPNWWTANLSFQYEFDGGWVVTNVALQRSDGGPLLVAGVHVTPLRDSLQSIHAFTLVGKRGVHYVFLLAAMAVVSVIATMLIACARAQDVRRKWLWTVFILCGLTGVTINWTTGQVAFVPVSVHLFGAAAAASSPYSPWLVTVSFPLGALTFLATRLRRRRVRADATRIRSPCSHEPYRAQDHVGDPSASAAGPAGCREVDVDARVIASIPGP